MTFKTSKPPVYLNHSNLKSTIIALELSSKIEHIHNILGGPEDERHTESIELFKDSLVWDMFYIVLYVVFFSLLFELSIRYANESNLYRIFFYFSILLAAVFDCLENYRISQILNARSEELVAVYLIDLKGYSLTKWISLFFGASLIGYLFWVSEKEISLKISAFFLFPTFFLSLIGIQKLKLIEVSLGMLSFGLLFILFYIAKHTYHSFRK
ncbi:MAG: hypothetical protein L6Q54_06420 [Leptospiraceae bacterium]|nr:hypothetical protein [Leptospiraceae bacterium]